MSQNSTLGFRDPARVTESVERFAEYSKSDVHEDAFLSQVSIAYRQEDFIGEAVIPRLPVKKESDKFPVWGREHLRPDVTLKADGSPANTVKQSLSKDSYDCDEHGLKTYITERERANADDPVDLEQAAVEFLTQKIQLRKEKLAAANIFASGSFATASKTDVSAGTQWTNNAGRPYLDIITAMRKAKRLCGMPMNTMVIGAAVFDQLQIHSDILDRIRYVKEAVTTEQVLASLFRVERVFIGESVEDTAAEGVAESVSDIWGKSVLVAHFARTPSLRTPTLAYEFSARARRVRKWFDEETANDWVEVTDVYDNTKMVADKCGHLLYNAVA